jgi:CheY-like chemotaxis protein
VAEDNPVNQMVALKMLERLGYRVDLVANGAEALAESPSGTRTPSSWTCRCPRWRATRRPGGSAGVRAPSSTPPVIAMSANALEGEREEALSAGMDHYVVKPVKA